MSTNERKDEINKVLDQFSDEAPETASFFRQMNAKQNHLNDDYLNILSEDHNLLQRLAQ